jgi:hypothetical protein
MKFLLGSPTPQIVNPRSLNRLLSLLEMHGNNFLRKVFHASGYFFPIFFVL